MAPKKQFQVHSLSKHIEDTKKGLSADTQYNRRNATRAPIIKKETGSYNPNIIFAKNGADDDDEASSNSDSSSDDEGGSDFLQKLGAPNMKTPTPAPRRRNEDVEIADSDVERNASTKNTTAARKPLDIKPEVESSDDSSTSSDTSSENESENDSDEAVKPAQPTEAKKPSPESSSEDSSSSESESESEAEPGTKANTKPAVNTNPTVNGKSTAATTSSSSSDESSSEEDSSSSESEEDEPVRPAGKSAQDDGSSGNDEEMADESMHIEDRQHDKQLTSVPKFIAPDFVLRKGEDGINGKDVAEICNQANLEGKQFWYFTVPSNVPISVVQNLEIPMDNSQRDSSLFSHGGDDYGVSFESIAPKCNIQILIPSADGSQYRSSTRQVSQVMQVKKITQLASLPSSTIGPAEKRAPRAQPKGLKSRYQPIGVNTSNFAADSNELEEDTEMTEAPIVSTTSKASGKKEKKRKEKDTLVLATPMAEKEKKPKNGRGSVVEPPSAQTLDVSTPAVARKGKRKHTLSEEDAAAATEQLLEESKSAVVKPKKQKTNRSGSPDLGSEAASTSTKKQTHVPPPAIPQSSPAPKSVSPAPPTTSKKAKKVKDPKLELPILSANSRQTPVPVPAVPHSSQGNRASSPIVTKEEKRAKKRKEKEAKASSAPASAKKVTPVPPPAVASS